MTTGIPGHNRGKRFVPGIGYVSRESSSQSDPLCKCGQKAWRWFTWSGYICELCHAIVNRSFSTDEQETDDEETDAEITIGGVKTLVKMDTASSLVVEHHVSGGTLMMVADDLAALRRDAEFPRLLAWIKDPNRKSPELAFTSGDARTIADLFVMHQRDADRWRKFVAKMNDDVMAPPVDAMVEAVDALPDPAP